MNERDRAGLVQTVGRLLATEDRAAAIDDVASCLGIEQVLFFCHDAQRNEMSAAAGFPQTCPKSELWDAFLATCLERARHSTDLPFSTGETLKPVTGLAWHKRAVLVLVGPPPVDEVLNELVLLLPFLATAFCQEHELAANAAQVRAADGKKNDFLAALSHELRTPLNPVLLIASEASENPELPAPVRRDFATIAKNAVVEARLIDDLLDLTRITRGKMSLDNRSLDLRTVLEDVIAMVRVDLEAKKIDLTAALDTRAHPAFGDSARLQQVFWNVLKNAIKFTGAGGHIQIETHIDEPARQIVITFTDSGVGMTPTEVERVFDSFTPWENTTAGGAHRFSGLGLGMTISRMLVHLHKGTIEATSAGREKGATFTVKLPLAVSYSPGNLPAPVSPPATPATSDAPPTPHSALAHHRVLIVEDHEPTSRVLARLLTRRGSDVVVAGSIAEALAAAKAGSFDAVISDIGLPDGDGYALMTTLKERHHLQGIAVSGYGMREDIERSEAAGFVAHVTKPVSMRALEVALELIRPPTSSK
jgi:signal transduction histidine kinase/CheY-like chemotaxis protein